MSTRCYTKGILRHQSQDNPRQPAPRHSCRYTYFLCKSKHDSPARSRYACHRIHVRIHAVLAWLTVHPGLHDSQFSAPFTGQSAPVWPTPLLHVQILPIACTSQLSSVRACATNTYECMRFLHGSSSTRCCMIHTSQHHSQRNQRRLSARRADMYTSYLQKS